LDGVVVVVVGSAVSDAAVSKQKAEQTRKTSNSDDASAMPGNVERNRKTVHHLARVLPIIMRLLVSGIFPLVVVITVAARTHNIAQVLRRAIL